MKRNEHDLSFCELMEIYDYLPEKFDDTKVRLLKLALSTATTFAEFEIACDAAGRGTETEASALQNMFDVADTYERAENVCLYCRAHDYMDLWNAALHKMLRLAATTYEINNVYVRAPQGSEVGDIALAKLQSME